MIDWDWTFDNSSTASTVISIIIIVMIVAAEYGIFEKAGEEGWKAIIPFYNSYIFYKISTGKGWLFILQYIPIVGFFVRAYGTYKLAKVFDRGGLFWIGLWLIPFICEMILGFGNDTYHPERV